MDRDDSAAAPRDVYPPTEVEAWGPGPRGPRAQRQVQAEMGRYTSEAERDRQAHNQALRARCSTKRSATARSAKEETARCSRGQRNMADMQRSSQAGDVATATPEANRGNRGPIARLRGAAADAAMRFFPIRRVPVMLRGPHEAAPPYHEDWTLIPGSESDPEKKELELKLRHRRNMMLREDLERREPVFFRSSGNSMWPLVQSDDGCTFHPIDEVTEEWGIHAVQKEASEIGVGDIVFCQVQPSLQYYAHIVLDVQTSIWPKNEQKYWIGNINGHINGWCLREHVFGILVHVQKWWKSQYWSRPLPKTVFAQVKELVEEDRWNREAEQLCEARWPAHSSWSR